MKMEIKKVSTASLKFGKCACKSWRSEEVPIIVDKELNVIFGETYAANLSESEVEVVVVDSKDSEALNILMHVSGKFCDYNYDTIAKKGPEKFGFGNFLVIPLEAREMKVSENEALF